MSKHKAVNIIQASIDLIEVHNHDHNNPIVKVAAYALYSALSAGHRFLLESIRLNGRVGRIMIGGDVQTTLADLTAMHFVVKDKDTGRYLLSRMAMTVMSSAQIDPARHVSWYVEDCKDVD